MCKTNKKQFLFPLAIYFLLLVIPPTSIKAQEIKKITVEDFTVNGTFTPNYLYELRWMKDGTFYTALENNMIVKYQVADGKAVDTVYDGNKHNLQIDEYFFSSDEKQLLIATDMEYIYRRSYTAIYYVKGLKEEIPTQLSEKRISYATFSPNGKMVAFVRDNDLFYTKLSNFSEYRVTDDGKKNNIINGSSDWVYEEELRLTKAFFWSPDNEKIAYYRFDEGHVKEYNMQIWSPDSLYPSDYKFKYPKAGEQNAFVDVFVHDLENNTTVRMDLGEDRDIYVPKVVWTKHPNKLAIKRLNRLQNRLDVLHCDIDDGYADVVFTDRSKTYVDVNYCSELIYLDNGEHFVMSSEREGYKHFYLHSVIDGQVRSKVTYGQWEAEGLVGIDQSSKKAIFYYTSTQDSHLERHLYKVDMNGKGRTRLSTETGINSASMSPDFKYYILYNHSNEAPYQIDLIDNRKGLMVKNLVENSSLLETHDAYGIQPKRFFTFEGGKNTQLNGYLVVPQDFDSTHQYPILIHEYSGPGVQMVRNNWTGNHFYWHQMMAQQGYLVAVVDTRGMDGRGTEFKKCTYKNLGKLELEDLMATADFLGDQPFVNRERIGIWGWSYGGYMSALSMMKGKGKFKCGISVAPVTNWRFYDTIYTERFLQKPQDNPEGYDDFSPLNNAADLDGQFLLIHGTGDDNVHIQNSIALQNKLVQFGKQFQSFFYPDQAHGLSGRSTRLHLYQLMTSFIKSNL